jgi:hypothetical protein
VRIVASYLAELLENIWLVLRCDADAGVSYGDLHDTVGLPSIDPDPSPPPG